MWDLGQEKFYKSGNLWWSISRLSRRIGRVREDDVSGPYCGDCFNDLNVPEEAYDIDASQNQKWKTTLSCNNCQKEYVIQDCIEVLKHFVAQEYAIRIRSQIPKESLDELPSNVKVRDADDKYFIAAKMGEKDGKRIGLVYFGEKDKDQKKEDYAQIFIDIDDDQLRFDKSNKHPKNILVKMRVEFPNSVHEETYRQKNKKK